MCHKMKAETFSRNRQNRVFIRGKKERKKKTRERLKENQRREKSHVRINRSTRSEAVRADVQRGKKEAEWSERKPTLAVTCAFPPWLAGVWHRSDGEERLARPR